MHYDRLGKQITEREFKKLLLDPSFILVKDTCYAGFYIKTIWTGTPEGEHKLIFFTTVTNLELNNVFITMSHSANEEEAILFHDKMATRFEHGYSMRVHNRRRPVTI
ncbi:MAG: hypothetical protein DRQ88_13045 [Epsilonproteobacteria bacterium]|nr:MAG: hypothetical protein DRQ88_13045 [Campylobacterota bacterium]